MKNNSESTLLRIYIGSTDRVENTLLTEKIVFAAKKQGLAGATVFKGIMGFGASSIIHSYKFWEVAEKVPVVIEIIDEESKIISFWNEISPVLSSMRYGCLVTKEKVDILLYKAGNNITNTKIF